MRTCQSVEERQANLSRKLTRATALLRSWVDVELERQNSVLLNSMDRRAKLQLRLQQTVEGLSVAAISYYVVGLIGYLAKGTSVFGEAGGGGPRTASPPDRCRSLSSSSGGWSGRPAARTRSNASVASRLPLEGRVC